MLHWKLEVVWVFFMMWLIVDVKLKHAKKKTLAHVNYPYSHLTLMLLFLLSRGLASHTRLCCTRQHRYKIHEHKTKYSAHPCNILFSVNFLHVFCDALCMEM